MSVWFCLASGPSQNQADIDAVRGRGTVVAINNQLLAAPWADIFYSCDSSWFEHYTNIAKEPKMARAYMAFRGEKFSIDPKSAAYGATVLKKESGGGLGAHAIRTGHNSGYQVLNLAAHRGAKTVVLLGYDMGYGPGGSRHNHGDHPKGLGNFGQPAMCVAAFPALARDLAAAGVNVVNCSRETALRCFKRMPLSQLLAAL